MANANSGVAGTQNTNPGASSGCPYAGTSITLAGRKRIEEGKINDMSEEELRVYTEIRANELRDVFAQASKGGEKNTTLSVGVVETVVNGKPKRTVVVTTSADNQKLHPKVQKALGSNEEFRATKPTLLRSDPYKNTEHDPNGPKDPMNNPEYISDSLIVDPKTGKTSPYTKANRGKPVEGTKHHAEQRMQNATKEGETLVTQQPTKSCCSGCGEVLGDKGLSKVPNTKITG